MTSFLQYPNGVTPSVYASSQCQNTDFDNLFTSQTGSDISFIVAGQVIKAHKLIVLARTPVFFCSHISFLCEGEKNGQNHHQRDRSGYLSRPSSFHLLRPGEVDSDKCGISSNCSRQVYCFLHSNPNAKNLSQRAFVDQKLRRDADSDCRPARLQLDALSFKGKQLNCSSLTARKSGRRKARKT